MILDLNTGKYRALMDTEHFFGFIVIDYLGRAYHPILGGDIARYDPRTDKLERLKQTIDGKPPAPEHKLALPTPDPINWDITPDGKTLYAEPMTCNGLFSYDLTATGDTIPGRSLGTLAAGAKAVDCRAMCVGPKGDVWSAITEEGTGAVPNLLHLVTYRAGDKSPTDLGCVSIRNPDYTEFTGKDGKPLPFHSGLAKLADGTWTTQHVILGVSQAQTGKVYALMLCPYTVLEIEPPARA